MSNTKQNLTNCANALSAAADALLEAVKDIGEMEDRITYLQTQVDKNESLKRQILQLLQEDIG